MAKGIDAKVYTINLRLLIFFFTFPSYGHAYYFILFLIVDTITNIPISLFAHLYPAPASPPLTFTTLLSGPWATHVHSGLDAKMTHFSVY